MIGLRNLEERTCGVETQIHEEKTLFGGGWLL
jgi:hypothetical protein